MCKAFDVNNVYPTPLSLLTLLLAGYLRAVLAADRRASLHCPCPERLYTATYMSRQLSPAEFCAEAPKVELHVHLEGAFDGPYLFECARKCVHDLPASVDLLDGRSMALQEAVRWHCERRWSCERLRGGGAEERVEVAHPGAKSLKRKSELVS